MTALGRDRDLHYDDGSHRSTSPSPSGRVVELHERRIAAHLAAHADRRAVKDAAALDELNLLLSAPEWPGASGMEDVLDIVRSTGRTEVPGAPSWSRH